MTGGPGGRSRGTGALVSLTWRAVGIFILRLTPAKCGLPVHPVAPVGLASKQEVDEMVYDSLHMITKYGLYALRLSAS